MLKKQNSVALIPSEEVNNYVVLGQIGVGTVATIYKAENTAVPFDSPLRCVAFKRLARSYEGIGKQESIALSALRDSKYIVDHFGSFTFKGEFVIALELLDYQREFSLLSRPRAFSSSDNLSYHHDHDGYTVLAKIAVQLLCAVVDIQSKGYVHCDLKPENILFEHGFQHKIKLIDFGNATTIKNLRHYQDTFELQSIAYRAPEVLLGDPTFNQQIDVWSVGVILLELYVNALFKSHGGGWRLVQHIDRKDIVYSLIKKFGSLDSYRSRVKYWDNTFDYRNFKNEGGPLFLQSLAAREPNENKNKVLSFLGGLLILDHNHRWSAERALQHPFLTSQLLGSWGQVLFPR